MFDVFLLILFHSSGQQNDNQIAIPTKVDTVSGTIVNPKFQDTCTDCFVIAKVSKLQSVNTRLNTCPYLSVLPFQP